METEQIQLTEIFNTTPSELFRAWLDSEQHTKFTGGGAIIKMEINSDFEAWDGYITGRITEFTEPSRIVQTWRTDEFPKEAEDSILEVLLQEEDGGCRVSLNHSNIPAGQGAQYKEGWVEHYFEPMKNYFQ